MVCFGGMPAVVPKNLIDDLNRNEKWIWLQSFKKNELKQEDKVGIIDGSFAGYKAIYRKMKSIERILVLLDIVGKNTQVTLSVHELEIA